MKETVTLLTPKSDCHLISPNNITPDSNIKVTRICILNSHLLCRTVILVQIKCYPESLVVSRAHFYLSFNRELELLPYTI